MSHTFSLYVSFVPPRLLGHQDTVTPGYWDTWTMGGVGVPTYFNDDDNNNNTDNNTNNNNMDNISSI